MSSSRVMANVLNSEIVGSDFELQSHNCRYIQTNTLDKCRKKQPLISSSYGLIISVLFFYKSSFNIR